MSKHDKIKCPSYILVLIFAAAFLCRIVPAYLNPGHSTDMTCFAAWADYVYEVGFSNFYSGMVFADYPPGYVYILYIIGALRSFFRIEYMSGIHWILLKLPAIICDLISGFLIFREAGRIFPPYRVVIPVLVYLFNPAIILNSGIWGQVDSVYTLSIVLLCLFLGRGKLTSAYIAYGLGILLKPQTLIFTPLLLIGIADTVFFKNFSIQKLLQNLINGLIVILGVLLLCVPFGLDRVILQYTSTLGSYPYASVNAYNFWSAMGLNWVSQDNTFLFLSYQVWGILVIILIVIFTLLLNLRMGDNPYKYPLLGSFIILTMFVFSVRMHERYMYPGLILLLMAYLYRPLKSLFLCYGIFSILHWCNTAHVLYFYDPLNYDRKAPAILIISVGMIFAILYFYYCMASLVHTPNSSVKEAA